MRSSVSLYAWVAAACCWAASMASAQARSIQDFDLPAQSLSASLRDVGMQGNVNVFFEEPKVEGKIAPAIKMRGTADEALTVLLNASGLKHRFLNENTVVLAEGRIKATTSAGATERDEAIKLAESAARSPSPSQGEGRGEDGRNGGDEDLSVKAGSQDETFRSKDRDVEEVVVTGSHIRGVENLTIPIRTLNSAYIESTGLSTTSQLIESLPQNFSLANQSVVVNPRVSGAGEQGTGINLRGIGEGTTLVLLNGRRIASGFLSSAVDISALPLSAVERVEILTDGASALYGSDAVGGVVNFILKKDFEGAETRFRMGNASGDAQELRFTQSLGRKWSSGNALVSLEYYNRDLLKSGDREFVAAASDIGSLLPRDQKYSGMTSIRQSLGEMTSILLDSLYTKRESYNLGGQKTYNERNTSTTSQLTSALGLEQDLENDWIIEVSGSYSRNNLDVINYSDTLVLSGLGDGSSNSAFSIRAGRIEADGPLVSLPGGELSLAVGADWRSESFEFVRAFTNLGDSALSREASQVVRSIFAELYIPLIGVATTMPAVRRLELSVAGRLDDYSSFGSSVDPRIGMMWEPVHGLRFRGSYGTAFAAPKLFDYSLGSNFSAAIDDIDDAAATGFSRQLQVFGTDVLGFSAQESKSASVAVQLAPDSLKGFHVDLNYYKITYKNQIANPPQIPSVVLGNASAFQDLIIRNPEVDQVQQYIALGTLGQGFFDCTVSCAPNPEFDPSTVSVIVDLRKRNLSVVKTSGIDMSLGYDLGGRANRFSFGLDGVYVFNLEQQVTKASSAFDSVSTFDNPPDWRARASFGWRHQDWSGSAFINYTDSYADNRTAAPVSIASYTSVDAHVMYAFPRLSNPVLSGLSVSASIQNLFNRAPPATAVLLADRDVGFDPANANPLGRFVSVEFSKAW